MAEPPHRYNITITVDENGNGSATIDTNSATSISSVASSLAPDSGPGGLVAWLIVLGALAVFAFCLRARP